MSKNKKRELQLKILEIVKEIDRICQKHNIKYYLVYGSCIGAVRHQGFIPWDDDLDIGMTYENYLKFIEVCNQEIDSNKYFLQTPESEPNYYLMFSKLRDITTTLVEEYNKNIDITYGVYVDIFPMVGVPKNKFKKKILKVNRAFALSVNTNVINSKFLYYIFRIILKLFGKKRILRVCGKNCVKYSCNIYDDWCSIFDTDGMEINMTTSQIMGKPNYVKFEDTFLPIPENYDVYLTRIYGDYTKIPPKEKQKTHEHYILDLNHSYQEYLKLNNKHK